jgi:hypothetical protein
VMIAAFSQSSGQKSRGTQALRWLELLSRALHRLNLPHAIWSHPIKRIMEKPIRAAHYLVNLIIVSRVAWGTHLPFKAPRARFLA